MERPSRIPTIPFDLKSRFQQLRLKRKFFSPSELRRYNTMSFFLSDSCSDWSTDSQLPLNPELPCSLQSCSSWTSSDTVVKTRSQRNEQDMSLSLFSTPRKRSLSETEDPFINSATCSSFATSTPLKLCDHRIENGPNTRPEVPDDRTDRASNLPGQSGKFRLRSQVETKHRRLDSPSFNVPSEDKDCVDAEHNSSIPQVSFSSETLSWSLFYVMEFNGCGERCVTVKHDLNEYDVLLSNKTFCSKDLSQQRQWMFDYFSNHCPNDFQGRKDPKSMKYFLCGKEICLPLWLVILSISHSRFYSIRKEFINGKSSCLTLKRARPMSAKSCQAIAWLTSYFDRIGDKRPDKDGIYLPTCLTEKSIYNRMVEDLHNGDSEKSVSFSQFNRLFRTEFSNVSIPKECRFTKCNFCTLIKNELQKVGITKADKTKLSSLLDDHLKLQEQERQKYYSNRQRSVESPDSALSLIIDGMDQNKTNVPSLVRIPKSCQNLWSLRTHLTGCLIHGVGSFNYIDFLQWPHDCNLTITTLLTALIETSKLRPLPSRMFLQMDNCVRENKNKYVLAFLLYLVEAGIFTEIELGFLMVGHTHEDIDQTFSCVSRYLRKHSALTIPALEAACKAANVNTRKTQILEFVVNFKEWIGPCIEEIHGHTNPHIFLFKKDVLGRSKMYFKKWSHDQWEPKDGVRLLKEIPDPSMLKLVSPSLHKIDLPHLTNDIKKYDDSGVLSVSDYSWWKRFLGGFELHYGLLPKDYPPCLVQSLSKIRQSTSTPLENPTEVPEKIQNIYSEQMTSKTEITIGKKKQKKSKSTTEKQQTTHTPLGSEYSVGMIAAFRLNCYADEIPQIGKIVKLNETEVTIEWWIGGYFNAWVEWKKNNKVVTETFPKTAILYGGFTFTKGFRLRAETIKILKSLYGSKELI